MEHSGSSISLSLPQFHTYHLGTGGGREGGQKEEGEEERKGKGEEGRSQRGYDLKKIFFKGKEKRLQ